MRSPDGRLTNRKHLDNPISAGIAMTFIIAYLIIGSLMAWIFSFWLYKAMEIREIKNPRKTEAIVGLLILLFWPICIWRFNRLAAIKIAINVEKEEKNERLH
tara:strand:- start:190 stop:495 length:306 start_codon:yes stop_codon:yes gene_type:complete